MYKDSDYCEEGHVKKDDCVHCLYGESYHEVDGECVRRDN